MDIFIISTIIPADAMRTTSQAVGKSAERFTAAVSSFSITGQASPTHTCHMARCKSLPDELRVALRIADFVPSYVDSWVIERIVEVLVFSPVRRTHE